MPRKRLHGLERAAIEPRHLGNNLEGGPLTVPLRFPSPGRRRQHRPAGQYSDTLLAGVVMVFGALAYKSAKKRWLGEAKSTMTRQLLEIALLVVVCVAVLAQPNLKHLMVTDPIPNVVIPVWAIVAYLVIAFKPRMEEKP